MNWWIVSGALSQNTHGWQWANHDLQQDRQWLYYFIQWTIWQQKTYDQTTGKKKKWNLKKSDILTLLQHFVYLVKFTSWWKNCMSFQTIVKVLIEGEIVPGWVNKPKGLLQILWECSWIDRNESLQKYMKDNKQSWLDSYGKVLPEFDRWYNGCSYQSAFWM